MNKQELTTLSELAKKRNVLKSKLLYYYSLGLYCFVEKKGKTLLFDKKHVNALLDSIERLQKRGMDLKEIRNRLYGGLL